MRRSCFFHRVSLSTLLSTSILSYHPLSTGTLPPLNILATRYLFLFTHLETTRPREKVAPKYAKARVLSVPAAFTVKSDTQAFATATLPFVNPSRCINTSKQRAEKRRGEERRLIPWTSREMKAVQKFVEKAKMRVPTKPEKRPSIIKSFRPCMSLKCLKEC